MLSQEIFECPFVRHESMVKPERERERVKERERERNYTTTIK